MNKLVFIVEDNVAQQKILQVHFEQTLGNYTARIFGDPEELMMNLNAAPYAIVLDHFFPNTNKTGVYYLKEVKRKIPHIPVIYYTTLDDQKVKDEVMALGAEQYIIKDSASLVRLRTALDLITEKVAKKGFFQRLFGK